MIWREKRARLKYSNKKSYKWLNLKLHKMIWREKARAWNISEIKFIKWQNLKLHIMIWREKVEENDWNWIFTLWFDEQKRAPSHCMIFYASFAASLVLQRY